MYEIGGDEPAHKPPMTIRSHNAAVSKTNTKKAKLDYNGRGTPATIHVGHLDVDNATAREYAREIQSEIDSVVDQHALHERGRDGIGYAEVVDGEFVGFTIYGQYKR